MEPATAAPEAPPQIERRRHTRYRLVERVYIHTRDGSAHPATTNEISISGMSAASAVILQPGELVKLLPVAGQQIPAVVRRKIGTMYGFEFASIPDNVVSELHQLCRGLLPFPGTASRLEANTRSI